jgi:cytochrome c oxidase subunit 2
MDKSFRLFPEQASALAPEMDALYAFLCAVTIFFTLLIFVLIVYMAFKYKRRSESERPRPTIESMRLEIVWTVIPFVIAMVIFFWGARLYFSVYADVKNPLDIHVVGKQWMWKIQHPSGKREINELHVPVNQRVQLTLGSQDVIHSFFVPAFRVKQDVVPGRYTKMSFTPTKPGIYHLFCAEYCGTQHSGMIGRVVVMEPDAYQQWLAGTSLDEPPAIAGAQLFAQLGCATCHGSQAPSMAGVYGSTVKLNNGRTVTADEQYIRESILDSTAKIVAGYPPIMPSFRGQLTEEQLMHLMAYIKSLADAAGPAVEAGNRSHPTSTQPADSGPSPAHPGAGGTRTPNE